MTGETITVHVDASDTAYMVKAKIEEKEGIDLEGQCLFDYNTAEGDRRELRDDHSLSDYNIQKEALLWLGPCHRALRELPPGDSEQAYVIVHYESIDDSNRYMLFFDTLHSDMFEELESPQDLIALLEQEIMKEMQIAKEDVEPNDWRLQPGDRPASSKEVSRAIRRQAHVWFTPSCVHWLLR